MEKDIEYIQLFPCDRYNRTDTSIAFLALEVKGIATIRPASDYEDMCIPFCLIRFSTVWGQSITEAFDYHRVANYEKGCLVSDYEEGKYMVMEFGQYKIDVDIKRTREFYEKAEPVSKGCSCDGCLNFEKAVGKLPLAVTTFFTNLGIDLRKVCECYVNCTNDDETILYGGFLHICGTLIHGDSAWKEVGDGVSHWEEDAAFCVSPDFHISFQEDLSLLEEDFPLPVIQLDFSANIPWVLDKENTYR